MDFKRFENLINSAIRICICFCMISIYYILIELLKNQKKANIFLIWLSWVVKKCLNWNLRGNFVVKINQIVFHLFSSKNLVLIDSPPINSTFEVILKCMYCLSNAKLDWLIRMSHSVASTWHPNNTFVTIYRGVSGFLKLGGGAPSILPKSGGNYSQALSPPTPPRSVRPLIYC